MHRDTYIGISIEIIGNGVGVGLLMIGDIYNPIVGWVIIGISSIVGIILICYGIRKKRRESNLSIGLLIGKSKGGKIINSHAKGKIIINGKSKD